MGWPMLCCVAGWPVLYCAVLCCAVLCSAVLCCAVLCCGVLCCTVSWYAEVCCTVMCWGVLHCVVPSHVLPCPCCAVLDPDMVNLSSSRCWEGSNRAQFIRRNFAPVYCDAC